MNLLIALTAALFLILWISVAIKPPRTITWKEIIDPPEPKKKKQKKILEGIAYPEYGFTEAAATGADGNDTDPVGPGGAGGPGYYIDWRAEELRRYYENRIYELQKALHNQIGRSDNYANMLAQAQRQQGLQPQWAGQYGAMTLRPPLFNIGQAVTHLPSGEKTFVRETRATYSPGSASYKHVYNLDNGMFGVPEEELR